CTESSAFKSDTSAPNAPTVSTTPASPAYTDGSGNKWWKDTVTVTFAANGDPNLNDGSAGSGADASTLSGPFAHSVTGSYTDSSTIKDNVGNESASTSLTTRVDASFPTITFANCPAAPVIVG